MAESVNFETDKQKIKPVRVHLTKAIVESAICPPNRAELYIWDDEVRGLGIRITPSGVKSYILKRRVETLNGKESYKVNFGRCDEMTLATARQKAKQQTLFYAELKKTPKQLIESIQDERAKKELEAREAAAAEELKRRAGECFTLAALCIAYYETLREQKKISWQQAKDSLELHVTEKHPEIAGKPAKEVTRKDVGLILGEMSKNGIYATASKVRACLVAAFNMALRSEGNPTTQEKFEGFEIENNPALLTDSRGLKRHIKPGDRTLNRSEIKAYIEALEEAPYSLARDALLLSFWTGGQRMRQLLRLRRSDFDEDYETILILDGKGNRSTPREHFVPLLLPALTILKRLDQRASEKNTDLLFASDVDSSIIISSDTVITYGSKLTRDLFEKNKVRAKFSVKDIRRTVETMLSGAEVSMIVRAHLQSHGLGGVQTRHYDKHEYINEKFGALEVWEKIVEESRQGIKPVSRRLIREKVESSEE